jgi:hypothetical protein
VHVFPAASQWKPHSRHRASATASLSAVTHSSERVSAAGSGHSAGQVATAASTVAAIPISARKFAQVACIGSRTAAQSAVHEVGIPPGGQATPSEQHAWFTMPEKTENSGKLAQLAGRAGTPLLVGGAVTVHTRQSES